MEGQYKLVLIPVEGFKLKKKKKVFALVTYLPTPSIYNFGLKNNLYIKKEVLSASNYAMLLKVK